MVDTQSSGGHCHRVVVVDTVTQSSGGGHCHRVVVDTVTE